MGRRRRWLGQSSDSSEQLLPTRWWSSHGPPLVASIMLPVMKAFGVSCLEDRRKCHLMEGQDD